MSADELLRAFCYFLLFPAYTYFALIAWNRKQWLIAGGYGLLAMFFALLMSGLVLRHYYEPVPLLLVGNTAVVVLLTVTVTWRATMTMMDALRAIRLERTIGRRVEFRVDSD